MVILGSTSTPICRQGMQAQRDVGFMHDHRGSLHKLCPLWLRIAFQPLDPATINLMLRAF